MTRIVVIFVLLLSVLRCLGHFFDYNELCGRLLRAAFRDAIFLSVLSMFVRDNDSGALCFAAHWD